MLLSEVASVETAQYESGYDVNNGGCPNRQVLQITRHGMVATIILGAIVGPSVYPRRYKTDTSKRFPRLLSARSLPCVPFPSTDFSALTTPLCSGSITGYSILPSSVTYYFILWQCTLPHPHAMPYFTPRTRGTSRSNHLHVPIGERPARPVPSTSNAR